MNELKLVYFSPTGATRKAVMETARNIDLKSVSFDFSVYKEKKPTLKFTRNDLAIFGIPVYYGRVPALFMEYLQNISGDNTPAALVATYGCREYEDALLELKTEVESRGFKVIGAAAFPAEHSIVPTIGARRPNKTSTAGSERKNPSTTSTFRYPAAHLTKNTEKMHFSRKQIPVCAHSAAPVQKPVRQVRSR